MFSRTSRAVAVFLALTIAGAAIAEDQPPNYAEPGFYAVLSAGVGFDRDDVSIITDPLLDGTPSLESTVFMSEVGNELAMGLRLGSRWKNWAVELDSDYLRGDVNVFSLTLNGRWYPLTSRIQPYLLAGLGMSYVRPKIIDSFAATKFGGTVFAMRVGGGGEFYFTEHIFADLGFVYHYLTGPAGREFNNQSFILVRGGLGYRFF